MRLLTTINENLDYLDGIKEVFDQVEKPTEETLFTLQSKGFYDPEA